MESQSICNSTSPMWKRFKKNSAIIYQFNDSNHVLRKVSILTTYGLQNIKIISQNAFEIFEELKKNLESKYFLINIRDVRLFNYVFIEE